MNHVSILRASFRENRKRAQYKSGNQVLTLPAVHPVGDRVSGAMERHGEQIGASHTGQEEFMNANGGREQFAKSCNKSEPLASPAAPLNPLWKGNYIHD